MRLHELRQMYRLEDSYWWFVGRRRLVRKLIDRYAPEREPLRILDAGCGTGGTLEHLRGMGELWGCDLAAEALQMCRRRGFEHLKQSRVESLDFPDERFSVVISCDVLEHVEADGRAMAEMARVLEPGGICVMTVPAHQWLWSEHDEALHHVRRYGTRRFRRLIEGAGLRIELMSKAVSFTLPAILAYRGWRRLRRAAGETPRTALVRLPGPINSLFVALLGLETALMRYVPLPIGASLVAVARKPEPEGSSTR